MTNDAWFGISAAPYQHAANSVFRAIENRRALIRSANTGLSCFIDRVGNIYNRVVFADGSLFVTGHKTDIVRFARGAELTCYTKFGDIFALFCGLIAAMAFLFDYVRRQGYNK